MNKPTILIGMSRVNVDGAVNVYCGRGSALGNPYTIHGDITRDMVCDAYARYLHVQANKPNTPMRRKMLELLGHLQQGHTLNLQCFCVARGLRCHCESIRASLLKAYEYTSSKSAN